MEYRQRIIAVKHYEIRESLVHPSETALAIARLRKLGYETVFSYGPLERTYCKPA
jgi:hypothetical protein